MSTYWYFECLSHEPPLRSDEEFTQHTGDRHWDRAMELAANRPVETDDSYWMRRSIGSDVERVDSYFNMQARSFLSRHPDCHLGLVNEYGERRELPAVSAQEDS